MVMRCPCQGYHRVEYFYLALKAINLTFACSCLEYFLKFLIKFCNYTDQVRNDLTFHCSSHFYRQDKFLYIIYMHTCLSLISILVSYIY